MDTISPVTWVIIIVFVLFIVGLNVSLISALRNPNRPGLKIDRKSSQSTEAARRMGSVLRDPLAGERNQLNELSDMVHHLEGDESQDQAQQPESGKDKDGAL